MAAAIEVEHVSMRFARPVLRDVSLGVSEGEVVSLVGPSGCGKTTLLRIIAGLLDPSSGEVRVNGDAPLVARRKRDIGMVFQQPALLPHLTALENIRLTLRITGVERARSPEELLEAFGLHDYLHYHPHRLSGGMRQRVGIACTVVYNPSVLLLDEPFGALDDLTREDLGIWLGGVLAEMGMTAVLVTHNIEEAVTLSDRVAVFSKQGQVTRVFDTPLPKPRSRETRLDPAFMHMVTSVRQALYAGGEGDNAG